MPLSEPCVFKILFFGDLPTCASVTEEIKRQLDLRPREANPAVLLQDFLGKSRPSNNGLQDTPCVFASKMYRLRVRYYPKGGDSDGIFILAVAMNSDSSDVTRGWQELESQFPTNLPNGLMPPITVYYAISDEEVTSQEVINLAQSLFPEANSEGLRRALKRAPLHCGNLYQLGTSERYFLFSSKEKEIEASTFATLSLPLLTLYLYSGDIRIQDKEGNLDTARTHMKEVSEKIRNKLNDYSSRGFGSITSEAERKDIFDITRDLWILNNNACQMLNLMETVNIAISNFKNLKERLLAPGPEEIFCQKERLLELQKAQLQADAAYLHNTFESGRVVLDSIEDHMELEYTRELKESNKKALSLQSAAFLIEFAIVFYYFLGSWHYILGEKFYEFTPFSRLFCTTIVASTLCVATHFFAKWRLSPEKKSYFYGLLGLLLPFLLTLRYIVVTALSFD